MSRRLLALTILALLLVPAGSAGAAPAEQHYVAKVKGSDAFIGLVKKGNSVRAYLCDGKPNRTSLSVWFQDRLRNASFRVVAAGVRLEATVYPRAAIGTILLADDRQYAFRAVLVKRRGGLLDRTDRVDGTRYRSGWIVLADYAARLLTWQRAVASNQSRIDAVLRRIDVVCGPR